MPSLSQTIEQKQLVTSTLAQLPTFFIKVLFSTSWSLHNQHNFIYIHKLLSPLLLLFLLLSFLHRYAFVHWFMGFCFSWSHSLWFFVLGLVFPFWFDQDVNWVSLRSTDMLTCILFCEYMQIVHDLAGLAPLIWRSWYVTLLSLHFVLVCACWSKNLWTEVPMSIW